MASIAGNYVQTSLGFPAVPNRASGIGVADASSGVRYHHGARLRGFMIRTRSPRSPRSQSFSSPPEAGWKRAGKGGSGSGGSFLVLIIARPRRARAGAVASAHRGIRFGFESRCGTIGLDGCRNWCHPPSVQFDFSSQNFLQRHYNRGAGAMMPPHRIFVKIQSDQ